MQRRGLTAGSGRKGYYNVIGKDPLVHSQSARGIKQPQRIQDLPLGQKVTSKVTAAQGRIVTKSPFAVQYRYQGKEHVRFTDPKYWKGGKRTQTIQQHNVFLGDDGTLDTIVYVDGVEMRYDVEFASQFRNKVTGEISVNGWKKLKEIAIEDFEMQMGGKSYKPAAPSFHVLSQREKDEIGNKVAKSGLRGMKALEYAEKLAHDKLKSKKGGKDMPVMEIDEFMEKAEHNEGILAKIGQSAGRAKSWLQEKGSEIATKMEERKAAKQSVRLKESKYGALSDRYDAQKSRVDSLKEQIANRQETGRDYSDLMKELEAEERQYRELQERLTQVTTQNFTDEELRQMAIRYKDDSLLGFGSNEYEAELLRRVAKRKEIDLKLKKAEEKPVESGSIFDI